MPEDNKRLPELLTIAQVAKILNVTTTTLRRRDKSGKLKAIRVGNKKDVVESGFIEFLQRYNYKSELKEMLVKAIEVNLEDREKSNERRIREIDKELLQLKAKAKQIVEKNFRGVLRDRVLICILYLIFL